MIRSSGLMRQPPDTAQLNVFFRFDSHYYGGCLEMAGIIIGSLISLAFAFLLGTIAEKRGAKVMFWAIMGAVFGPLAIPFVFFAKQI